MSYLIEDKYWSIQGEIKGRPLAVYRSWDGWPKDIDVPIGLKLYTIIEEQNDWIEARREWPYLLENLAIKATNERDHWRNQYERLLRDASHAKR
jgi:hypothetical protein